MEGFLLYDAKEIFSSAYLSRKDFFSILHCRGGISVFERISGQETIFTKILYVIVFVPFFIVIFFAMRMTRCRINKVS